MSRSKSDLEVVTDEMNKAVGMIRNLLAKNGVFPDLSKAPAGPITIFDNDKDLSAALANSLLSIEKTEELHGKMVYTLSSGQRLIRNRASSRAKVSAARVRSGERNSEAAS